MRALTTAEKRKLFEGHALFGILSAEDIDVLLAARPFRRLPSWPCDFRQGLAGTQHDGRARRGGPYQHHLAEWP